MVINLATEKPTAVAANVSAIKAERKIVPIPFSLKIKAAAKVETRIRAIKTPLDNCFAIPLPVGFTVAASCTGC
mgnify:CR=1 FL=1